MRTGDGDGNKERAIKATGNSRPGGVAQSSATFYSSTGGAVDDDKSDMMGEQGRWRS